MGQHMTSLKGSICMGPMASQILALLRSVHFTYASRNNTEVLWSQRVDHLLASAAV